VGDPPDMERYYAPPVLRGTKSIETTATAAEAYARVADVAHYPTWQSFVVQADVLERDADGRAVLVATRLDAKVKELDATLRYTYDAPHRVSWHLERGDLKGLDGSFEVDGTGATTRVTLTVAVDPGMRLGLLLRGPVEERVRARVLDGTLDELAATLA
jgi:ribosome-associated toxin RatA of RatAB toxin-antitoxin module